MSARAPLTPPDCDLRDFPRMMVDISRLRQSDFDATIDDSAWRAGVNLWFSAWHSVPAGSLAADDASLAKASGLGRDVRTWRKVRDEALRGFVLCTDGRLYHETVCEFALEAWLEKLVQRISSGAGNAKRWGGAFDPCEIEAEIDAAADMLSALNPQSRAIQKAKRRHSRRGPDGTADGNPTGKRKPSHRDSENVPPGSQGTGKGKEEERIHTPEPLNRARQSTTLPADVRSVMEEGGFVTPPPDLGMLREWYGAGATLDQDILPMVRRVAASLSKPPFKLKVFDAAIREKLAADAREIERLGQVARRYSEPPGSVQ